LLALFIGAIVTLVWFSTFKQMKTKLDVPVIPSYLIAIFNHVRSSNKIFVVGPANNIHIIPSVVYSGLSEISIIQRFQVRVRRLAARNSPIGLRSKDYVNHVLATKPIEVHGLRCLGIRAIGPNAEREGLTASAVMPNLCPFDQCVISKGFSGLGHFFQEDEWKLCSGIEGQLRLYSCGLSSGLNRLFSGRICQVVGFVDSRLQLRYLLFSGSRKDGGIIGLLLCRNSESGSLTDLRDGGGGLLLCGSGLLLCSYRQIMSIGTSRADFPPSQSTQDRQSRREKSHPFSGGRGSARSLIVGCFFFALGFMLMKFSFNIADAPYGSLSWGERSLYLGLGLGAFICLCFAIPLMLNSLFAIFHTETVTQKGLTRQALLYYSKDMANILPVEKQAAIIGSLCEGSNIRSIERLTGVHRDTVMRLGVRVGQGCTALLDAKMRNLSCARLEMDEVWGFIGKKERHVRPDDDLQFGDVWTYCAIDADTKLVPAFRVAGDRDVKTTTAFVIDVADRMRNRLQISTDGLKAYVDAIATAFGGDVDYGQVIKTCGTEQSIEAHRRYSAPAITSIEKKAVFGRPEFDLISTSYVERLNATTRLHMKRLARLTHAFSKKRENFEAAVGLHFAYYNFVKRHITLRTTPAVAAGVSGTQWTVAELLKAVA